MSPRSTRKSQRGLTLVETLVAITIFSIMTLGTIPLLGTALKGGATTRTESVARNVATKTLERLRGFQYHVAYSSTNRKIDLLDHFFPGQTPAYVASLGTGYDSATGAFVTTCDSISSADACAALPDSAEIPDGYVVEVRATFRSEANPAAPATIPSDYAWNGNDTPPSDLLEVRVAVTWAVGAETRTYDLRSYLSSRGRLGLPASGGSGGGGGAPAPTPTPGGGSTAPNTVKLRGEARIDYGYEVTTTYQDGTGRLSEYTGTLGNAIAYGEQLDSGSKAELAVRAGRLRIVRPANPAVVGDTGFDADVSGAILDARAPADATTTVTTTAPAVTATTSEVPASIGSLMASEAGTLTGTRGVSPTVAGGLPFVKGYYDLNGTAPVSPISNAPTHFWTLPQAPTAAAGTTDNPLGLTPITTTQTPKTITISDWQFGAAANVDPRGEVMVDSTATSPADSRMVTSSATIPNHGMVVMFPMHYSALNNGVVMINSFSANVSCVARADAAYPSTATGSWSAQFLYPSYEGTRRQDFGRFTRTITLPVQTRTDNPQVPNGTTNPLEVLRSVNNGNGPKIYDVDQAFGDSAGDAYLFAGNGKRGLLTGLSQGSIQTTISPDDRVVSAQLNGAIRLETSPLNGPWGASSKPQSDLTFAMGKLSCKAEDYR